MHILVWLISGIIAGWLTGLVVRGKGFGYGGPCPSDGKAHRYVVRLYALDRRLRFTPGATREEVLKSIEGHVIEEAELTGRYMRLADR